MPARAGEAYDAYRFKVRCWLQAFVSEMVNVRFITLTAQTVQ